MVTSVEKGGVAAYKHVIPNVDDACRCRARLVPAALNATVLESLSIIYPTSQSPRTFGISSNAEECERITISRCDEQWSYTSAKRPAKPKLGKNNAVVVVIGEQQNKRSASRWPQG